MILDRKAPAKVNLGLHVLRKRADGYHDIETVFLAVPWYDQLRASPAEAFTFTCSDPELPVDARNLCVKAAHLLGRYAAGGQSTELSLPGVALHLEKYIPYGAGLGGGSSDAAHTLRLLNAGWALGLEKPALHGIAAALGSDVPFFLEDQPMYAEGRGEILSPLRAASTGEPYVFPFEIVIAVPEVHVATAAAYRGIVPDALSRPDLKALVLSNDLAAWREHLVNDFERTVFRAHPVLGAIKQQFLAAGAGYAAMSGSGSAVFGVFEQPGPARAAAREIEDRKLRVWKSCDDLE